jgi:hypothetical protein
VPKAAKGASVIVHIREQSAGVYIARGHFVEFSSVVSLGDPNSLSESAKAIRSEVERAVEFWSDRMQKQSGANTAIYCYLCGEMVLINTVSEELRKIEGLVPRLADVWQNLFSIESHVPELNLEDSLRFAPSIGLFLEN